MVKSDAMHHGDENVGPHSTYGNGHRLALDAGKLDFDLKRSVLSFTVQEYVFWWWSKKWSFYIWWWSLIELEKNYFQNSTLRIELHSEAIIVHLASFVPIIGQSIYRGDYATVSLWGILIMSSLYQLEQILMCKFGCAFSPLARIEKRLWWRRVEREFHWFVAVA